MTCSTRDWQLDARCRGESLALFYPPDHERPQRRRQREARAKSICRECIALASCRAYALQAREPHGIWGALNPQERMRLLAPPTAQLSGH